MSRAEAKPAFLPHSASKCKLCTAQWEWKKTTAGQTLQSPEMLDSAVLPPGSCGTAASKRCSGKKTSPSRPTVQHRAAAAPTDTVRCRDDGFLLDARLRR